MPFGEPVAYLALGTVVLGTPAVIAVCYAKGEPPRWRWGRSRDS